ncbi:MAG: DM13 domain-containing protein [Armatimonadota bacterium]
MRRRIPRWMWWVIGLVVIAGAPIAWYLGSPLFIDKVVDEPFPTSTGSMEFPMSKGATVPEGMTQKQVEEKMSEASKVETSSSEAMPAGASQGAIVARGAFTGADDFHKGEGTATVYRAGQELVLRLDQFKVTNGPDLRVILTKSESPKTRADVQEGYIEVARLKGNVGSQNYNLPQGVTLAEYKAVVIYCKPFHFIFATAPLKSGN